MGAQKCMSTNSVRAFLDVSPEIYNSDVELLVLGIAGDIKGKSSDLRRSKKVRKIVGCSGKILHRQSSTVLTKEVEVLIDDDFEDGSGEIRFRHAVMNAGNDGVVISLVKLG